MLTFNTLRAVITLGTLATARAFCTRLTFEAFCTSGSYDTLVTLFALTAFEPYEVIFNVVRHSAPIKASTFVTFLTLQAFNPFFLSSFEAFLDGNVISRITGYTTDTLLALFTFDTGLTLTTLLTFRSLDC